MSHDPGLFITVEGIDGCGKSTQAALLAQAFEASGREVVRGREPGGAALAEKIRALLLDPSNVSMVPECELLLFEAGRAQNVREVIQPALARGAVVIFDRFFDSTYAYQLAARGLDLHTVSLANQLGSCGVSPDVTLVFDLPPEQAAARRAAQANDRIEAEGLAFQGRVREGYRTLAQAEPERVKLVDATGAPDEVFALVCSVLAASNAQVRIGALAGGACA